MFCQNCGRQLEETANFCPACGTAVSGKEEKMAEVPAEAAEAAALGGNEKNEKLCRLLFHIGFGLMAAGVILFLGIAIVGLIGWGAVIMYNGYDYTAVLVNISLVLMLLGFMILAGVCVVRLVRKATEPVSHKIGAGLMGLVLACGIGFSAWILPSAIDYYSDSHGSSYDSSYDAPSSGLSKQLGLTLSVDNIKQSGNYSYVNCSVSNVSAKYGVATQYRYVKVKGVFKDWLGNIMDTDSTYAVDTVWLNPGEKKTFQFMIRGDVSTATLSHMD